MENDLTTVHRPNPLDHYSFPQPLTSLEELRQHFEAEFDGISTTAMGDKFASFVEKLVPQTDIGYDFEKPVINSKRSNDGGVDLVAQGKDGRSILYIQAKFTVNRAEAIDNVISKFQDFYLSQQTPHGGRQGVLDLESKTAKFLLVTLSPLDGILKSYSSRNFGSKQFFDICSAEDRIHFTYGQQVLSTLRAAYLKTNQIPADLTLDLETDVSNIDNVFLGIMSSQEIQRLYQEFGDALFFENIRDFLGLPKERAGRSTPNQEIIKTVRDTPIKMLERNNGIVIKAETVKIGDNTRQLRLTKGSIVNGCQTTMCIVDYAKQNCFVPVKIVQTADSWDIAKAANYQNSVEAIDLDLARYLRPQLVKRAAVVAGVRLEDGADSVLQILDQIYDRRVAYEETRLLYIGLFSRKPNNLFTTNYTELLGDLLKKFESDTSYEDQVFGTLFELQGASQEGLSEAEKKLSNDSYVLLFKRLYSDESPPYRCFVSILAACAAVGINIAERKGDTEAEYKRMQDFFAQAKTLLLNNKDIFIRYYILAVKTWMQAVLTPDSDETTIQRDMNSLSKRLPFTNLFIKLNMDADVDDTLQSMKLQASKKSLQLGK